MKQTTSQSWDWHEKSIQHIYNMANHRTTPLSWNGFTPLDCQCFKTNNSFKHRNAFYKNEAIIRLSSHHTMQRKPEDRVLPYNGQNMLDTNKTKAYDIITSVYMFQKQFRTITISHRRHGYHISCRHIYIQSKPHDVVFRNWISVMNQGKR